MRLEVETGDVRLFPGKCVFLPSAKTPEEGGRERRQGSHDRAHRRQGSHTRAHLAAGSHDVIPVSVQEKE